MKKLSIIIPIRYRIDLLKVCLLSLKEFTKDLTELILVVDGEDQLSEVSEALDYLSLSCKIKVIKESVGYVKAINEGFRKVDKDNEYVMFLNSDTVLTEDWSEKMLEAFDKMDDVGLVAPTITIEGGKQSIEQNRKGLDYEVVDYVIGVCIVLPMFLAMKLVDEKGNILDERFDLGGGDDSDLCLRVRKAGYKVVIARNTFIYHYISASFREKFNHDVSFSKRYSASVFHKFREKWKNTPELEYKPRVFIAIPTMEGKINSNLVIRLIEWTHLGDVEVGVRMYPNLKPLDNARNRAVKEFLEGYWDYIMFIDDKVCPSSNSLRELLLADKDVIAPVVFTMKQDDDGIWFPFPVAMRYAEDGRYKPYYGNGVEEVDAITGGCFLVKREIMELLERPFYFTYHKNGIVEYSEDFIFSQQVQKLGRKLYTHYGLTSSRTMSVDVLDINNLAIFINRRKDMNEEEKSEIEREKSEDEKEGEEKGNTLRVEVCENVKSKDKMGGN